VLGDRKHERSGGDEVLERLLVSHGLVQVEVAEQLADVHDPDGTGRTLPAGVTADDTDHGDDVTVRQVDE
jgi:hypothetical protein